MMLATLMPIANCQVEITPMLLEPTQLGVNLDEIALTDIDSIPGYTIGDDMVVAVGIWTDKLTSDYVIFVINIKDEGVTYEVHQALLLGGSHTLSSAPNPKIHIENTKYLVSFTHPENGDFYAFQQTKGETDLSQAKFL